MNTVGRVMDIARGADFRGRVIVCMGSEDIWVGLINLTGRVPDPAAVTTLLVGDPALFPPAPEGMMAIF